MTAALAFIRAFWKPLAGVLAAGVIWWAVHHFGAQKYAAGYQQAVSEQTAAAAKKAIENAQKERDDAKRIADAYKARDESEAVLAGIRARPAPAPLVCHRAPSRGSGVPEAAGVPGAQTPRGGLLPEPDAGDSGGTFDPSPAAIELAFEAARVVADCRMLNQDVNGVPTR